MDATVLPCLRIKTTSPQPTKPDLQPYHLWNAVFVLQKNENCIVPDFEKKTEMPYKQQVGEK